MPALALWRAHAFLNPSELVLIIPLGLVALARADRAASHHGWSVVRDWVPAALMLVAYWSIDWAAKPSANHELENALIGWDRTLLNHWGLRAAVYLLLYAVPPLAITGVYCLHERDRVDDLLYPLLVGTLVTYSLLPHFPSEAPRVVFAGQDLPAVETTFRRLNVWILDHWDIRSSVFPSGHVAVAFSAAIGMWRAVPRNRGIALMLLALTVLVWINTIYGRYHYAADGLAGISVSAFAISVTLVGGKVYRLSRRSTVQH